MTITLLVAISHVSKLNLRRALQSKALLKLDKPRFFIKAPHLSLLGEALIKNLGLLGIAVKPIKYAFQNPNMIRRAKPAESYLGFIYLPPFFSAKMTSTSAVSELG